MNWRVLTLSKYSKVLTVKRLIDFLEMVEDKEKKIMVTSLGNFGNAHTVIGADSIEISTDGIPGVYLTVDD